MLKPRRAGGLFQFIQFSAIGIGNGALDLAALNLLLWMYPSGGMLRLFWINTVAYALAVLNSYIWNSRLTFRRQAFFGLSEKLLFVTQAVVSLFISNIVFVVFTGLLGFLPMPLWVIHNTAKLISMLISSVSSFFFMKYFVFRKKLPTDTRIRRPN